jgi:hypothetical protein
MWVFSVYWVFRSFGSLGSVLRAGWVAFPLGVVW